MNTTTLTKDLKNRQLLRLRIQPTIDELEEIESKICTMMINTPDCPQEFPQPFIDKNSDYLNPLHLKDNSSRIKVFHHIEEAERLAENNSHYIMQPLPLHESISWTLKPHIPITSYELTPNADLETHPSDPIKSGTTNLFPSLLPFVTLKNEQYYKVLSPIQEHVDNAFSFKNHFPLKNAASCDVADSNIGVEQLQKYFRDNKSIDVSPSENNTDAINFEHSEDNICPNYTENKDEIGSKGFGGTIGTKNKKSDVISENESELENMFTRNLPNEGVMENYDGHDTNDKKNNFKFQYANFISENWEKEIRESSDCIILVCKECGFEQYT